MMIYSRLYSIRMVYIATEILLNFFFFFRGFCQVKNRIMGRLVMSKRQVTIQRDPISLKMKLIASSHVGIC